MLLSLKKYLVGSNKADLTLFLNEKHVSKDYHKNNRKEQLAVTVTWLIFSIVFLSVENLDDPYFVNALSGGWTMSTVLGSHRFMH